MKTILFAWELGHGLGHVMNIRRIAARLKAHDFRLVAAVNDLSCASFLEGVVGELIKAPPWRSIPASQQAITSSATLNDILSAAGLDEPLAVRRLLVEWDDIFTRIQPNLVIADFSPLATLAARRRIPLVLIGNGYTLPPHEMVRFPLLHRYSHPVSSEAETLAAVNKAVRLLGWPPLERLPQLFSGDACLVQTFPLLDPYDTQRTEPLDGPIFDQQPVPCSADSGSIFAYLSSGHQPHPSTLEALMSFAAQLRVYAPRLTIAQSKTLRSSGAKIETDPVPLAEVFSSVRLFVHTGGTGVAAEALVAGVPQLVCSQQVEQDLNGEALERVGVAKLVKTYEPGTTLTSELINSVMTDDAFAARAADLGSQHRNYMKSRNALLKCESTCLKLMGF